MLALLIADKFNSSYRIRQSSLPFPEKIKMFKGQNKIIRL
jgi:hypothetical protein